MNSIPQETSLPADLLTFLENTSAYLWWEDFTALLAAVKTTMQDNADEPVALESQVSLCLSTLLDAAEAAPQVKYANARALTLYNAAIKTTIELNSLICRAYQGLLRDVVMEIWQGHTAFERHVYWLVGTEKLYIKLQFRVQLQQPADPGQPAAVQVFVVDIQTGEPGGSSASEMLIQHALLYQVTQLVLTNNSTRRFLESIVSLLHHHYESYGTVVALVDLEKRIITRGFLNDHEMTRDELEKELPSAHFWDGLSGWAIRTRETIYSPKEIPDFRENRESMLKRNQYESGAIVVVPIIHRQQVLGTLTIVGNGQQAAIKKHDIQIAEMVANQIAIGLRHFELQERTQRMIHTDLLTGLANREHFLQLAELEFEKAMEASDSLGVIMLDVDQFKRINDQHGNLVGDDVLHEIAERLSLHLKPKGALVSRFDGDEFCVMLHIRSLRALQKLADELRIAIANEPIISTPIVIKATISAGICCIDELHEKPGSLREFLNLGSQALLEAKAHGRNCVWHQSA